MTADSTVPHAVEVPESRGGIFSRVPWALLVLVVVVAALVADRVYYVRTFGAVYTEADQTMLWYQADDIAHGIIRTPCFYGQAYNVPVEAWVAVPLLWCRVPPPIALPVATILLALFPFGLLAGVAFWKGQRWGAVLVMMIPLALPVEYVVETSIPRGFVGGIAVGAVAVALWVWGTSRKAFFFAGLFAVLAGTVNPNASVLLLAVGVYALLVHWREWRFYVFSGVGVVVGLAAPVMIHLFYKYHEAEDIYRSQPPVAWHWQMWRETVLAGHHLNMQSFDLFFGDFFPGHRGWWVVVVFAGMIGVPLVLRRWRAAVALGVTVVFVVGTLGIVRVHLALPQPFYSGARMYLAVPVVFALFVLWCVRREGAGNVGVKADPEPTVREESRVSSKAGGALANGRGTEVGGILRVGGGVLLGGLVVGVLVRNVGALKAIPSPLIERTWPMDIERVQGLAADARVTAEICRKYGVTMVIPADHFLSCFEQGGPVLSGYAFETFYPPVERRAWRVEEERTRQHSAVLIYRPSLVWRLLHQQGRVVSRSPYLLLIELDKPDNGFHIAETLGFGYNAHV